MSYLSSPRYNKGTAFTPEERSDFELCGRLPFQVNSLEHQCDRAYNQVLSRPLVSLGLLIISSMFQLLSHESDIRKNAFLQSLKAQNWVLYYSLLSRHLGELTPIIYTPTEVRQ